MAQTFHKNLGATSKFIWQKGDTTQVPYWRSTNLGATAQNLVAWATWHPRPLPSFVNALCGKNGSLIWEPQCIDNTKCERNAGFSFLNAAVHALTTMLRSVKCEVRNVQFTEGKREIFGSWWGDCEDCSHMECDSVVSAINLATFQVYVLSPFPE